MASITVVSSTDKNQHLTATGFRGNKELVKHLRERLESETNYVWFVVVISDDEIGNSVMQFNRHGCQRYCDAVQPVY